MSKAAPPTLSASGPARRARASWLGSLAARSRRAERVRRESARDDARHIRRGRSHRCARRARPRARTPCPSPRLPRSLTTARRYGAPWQARCRFGLDEAAAVRKTSDSEIVCALPRSTQPRDQHRSPVLCPELPPQHVCHVAVSLGEGATWSAHEVCLSLSLSLKAEARAARRGQKHCHQPWADSCPTI